MTVYVSFCMPATTAVMLIIYDSSVATVSECIRTPADTAVVHGTECRAVLGMSTSSLHADCDQEQVCCAAAS